MFSKVLDRVWIGADREGLDKVWIGVILRFRYGSHRVSIQFRFGAGIVKVRLIKVEFQ